MNKAQIQGPTNTIDFDCLRFKNNKANRKNDQVIENAQYQ